LNVKINIDTDAFKIYTNKLQKLHKSAYPVAIRETLNNLAFDLKTNTMLKYAKSTFIERKKNFFKANSRVEKATGFNINDMGADVGFVSSGLHNESTNYAVRDLEQQEHGGSIHGRSLIAMKKARSASGVTKRAFTMDNLKNNIVKTKSIGRTNRGKNIGVMSDIKSKKQRFIHAAFIAKQQNKLLMGNPTNGNRTVFKVDELWGSTARQGLRSSRKLYLKLTPLFRVKKGRVVNVKHTDFMQRASLGEVINADKFFIENAMRQIKRLTK
jgi:hypothetical protein